MTRLLDRLEARGLIDRERLPGNRRVVEIGITAAGLELLETSRRRSPRMPQAAAGPLVPDDLTALNALLDRCRARTSHPTPTGPPPRSRTRQSSDVQSILSR